MGLNPICFNLKESFPLAPTSNRERRSLRRELSSISVNHPTMRHHPDPRTVPSLSYTKGFKLRKIALFIFERPSDEASEIFPQHYLVISL